MRLVLPDDTVLQGRSFGGPMVSGEVVFYTGMVAMARR
jgi:carbamoylphosphate synthase small subunit